MESKLEAERKTLHDYVTQVVTDHRGELQVHMRCVFVYNNFVRLTFCACVIVFGHLAVANYNDLICFQKGVDDRVEEKRAELESTIVDSLQVGAQQWRSTCNQPLE